MRSRGIIGSPLACLLAACAGSNPTVDHYDRRLAGGPAADVESFASPSEPPRVNQTDDLARDLQVLRENEFDVMSVARFLGEQRPAPLRFATAISTPRPASSWNATPVCASMS